MTETRVRAGGENGPVITLAKAATIIATGGRVTVCAVDAEGENTGSYARVSGGFVWNPKTPTVSWPSFGETTPDDALASAAVIKSAGEIAKVVTSGQAQKLFETVPHWVAQKLTGCDWTAEDVQQRAAMRYHHGDASYHDAWKHAIDSVLIMAEKGVDIDG